MIKMETVTLIAVGVTIISQFIVLCIQKEIMTRIRILEKGYKLHLKVLHDHENHKDMEVIIPLTMN